MKLVRTDSSNEDFQKLVPLLDRDLAIRDGDEHAFFAQYNKSHDIRNVVVVYVDDVPVGCGAFKEYALGIAEIKRMYVLPTLRGHGLAQLVLRELEQWAQAEGYKKCILETGEKMPEAIGLYQKAGYQRIPNYGQYVGVAASRCFEKVLG